MMIAVVWMHPRRTAHNGAIAVENDRSLRERV
jgi:hypothetical protein